MLRHEYSTTGWSEGGTESLSKVTMVTMGHAAEFSITCGQSAVIGNCNYHTGFCYKYLHV